MRPTPTARATPTALPAVTPAVHMYDNAEYYVGTGPCHTSTTPPPALRARQPKPSRPNKRISLTGPGMLDAQIDVLAQCSEELKAVESRLEEEEERLAGLETMLEVKLANTDEFTGADVELTEGQLATCTQTIAELEAQFAKLTSQTQDLESELHAYESVVVTDTLRGGDAAGVASPMGSQSSLPPMSPTSPMTKKDKLAKIVAELIATEQALATDLTAVVDCYVREPRMADKGVDLDKLFCNIVDIAAFSKGLLALFLEEQSKPADTQAWGHLFKSQADDIKSVYVKYCVNFDSANALFNDVYCADVAMKAYFAECHTELNKITTGWDLNNFLIKPVQRVMKYPMLLMEILKKTDDGHPDLAALREATERMSDVAKLINEGKRTKELTERYGPSSKTAKQKGGGGFLHAVSKKSGRMLEKIGGTKSKDGEENREFGNLALQVKELEMSAKELRKTVTKYANTLPLRVPPCVWHTAPRDCRLSVCPLAPPCSAFTAPAARTCVTPWELAGAWPFARLCCRYRVQVRAHSQSLVDMGNKLLDVFDSTGSEVVAAAVKGSFDAIFVTSESFSESLEWKIISPMKKLLALFEAPNKLIEKRADKFLDCERARRKFVAASKDPERAAAMKADKDIAENTYIAMNKLLLDELPTFIELGTAFLGRAMDALLGARLKFANECRDALAACDFVATSADETFAGIMETHKAALQQAVTNLAESSRAVAGSAFAKEFGAEGVVAIETTVLEFLTGAPKKTGSVGVDTATSSKAPPPPPPGNKPRSTHAQKPPNPFADAPNPFGRNTKQGMEVPVPAQRGSADTVSPARAPPEPTTHGGTGIGKFTVCAFTFVAESQFELTINDGERLQIKALSDPAGNDQWMSVACCVCQLHARMPSRSQWPAHPHISVPGRRVLHVFQRRQRC